MEPSEVFSGFNLSLDQGIAQNVGMDAALIFNHIVYWLKINANKPDAEMIDGKYWMYETNKQMSEFFGFMSEDQICRGIKKLKEAGLIETKPLNKNPFDRTLSYTVFNQELIKKSLRNPENSGIDKSSKKVYETANLRNADRTSAESDSANLRNLYKDTTEEQHKTNNIKAAAAAAKEKTAPSTLIYKNTKGDAVKILESDIYAHFLTLPYETEEIQKAIEQVRSCNDFIGNIFKYIEAICLRIHNDKSLKPKESKKKTECNIPDTSNQPKVNFGEFMKKHHGIDLGKK